jgi:ribulose 1,5-bisphosphate carboxylase large subunit-like protein
MPALTEIFGDDSVLQFGGAQYPLASVVGVTNQAVPE